MAHQIPPRTPTDSTRWKQRNAAPPRKARQKPTRRFPPEVLSDIEVRALMDACHANSPAGIRNRALIAVLYRSGLRIREALQLQVKDIDLARGCIRVLHAKGGRSRTVGIDRFALAYVEHWLATRIGLGLSDRDPVFCTVGAIHGRPLTDSYVRVFLPRLARRAGIQKRVHAHGLRHTHAAELRAEGIDIGVISKQLGHRSISTTAHYLDHIAPWQVVEVVGRREW